VVAAAEADCQPDGKACTGSVNRNLPKKEIRMADKLSPIHPGEVLLEEFIKPMNLSQNRIAIDIGVDARRINEIVLGKRSVTADTALRLARYFGNSPQFWMGLQNQYDLDITEDHLGKRLEREVRPLATAI
jgi:addiction module HigA family antidote